MGKREKRGSMRVSVLAGVCLLALSACANPYDPGQRALTGAGIGAGSGAAIGSLAGKGRGAAIGGLAGGALGALGGYVTTPNRAPGQQVSGSPYYGLGSTAVAQDPYYGRDNGFRTPTPSSGAYVGQPASNYGTPSGYGTPSYGPSGSASGQVSY